MIPICQYQNADPYPNWSYIVTCLDRLWAYMIMKHLGAEGSCPHQIKFKHRHFLEICPLPLNQFFPLNCTLVIIIPFSMLLIVLEIRVRRYLIIFWFDSFLHGIILNNFYWSCCNHEWISNPGRELLLGIFNPIYQNRIHIFSEVCVMHFPYDEYINAALFRIIKY